MSEKEKKKAEELSDVFKDLGSAFRIVNSEFADLMTSISAGINTFESLKRTFNMEEEGGIVKNCLNSVSKLFGNANEKIQETTTNAFKAIEKSYNELSLTLKNEGVKGALNEINENIKKFGSTTKDNLTSADGKFQTFFGGIKEKGTSSFGKLKTSAVGAFATLRAHPFAILSKAVAGFGAIALGVFSASIVGGIALAVVAITSFIAYFNQLMETNEEFREKITVMWEGVGEAFQPAIDAFGELFACLVTGKESVDEQGGEITESFLSVATSIIEGITGIVTLFSDIVTGVVEFIKEILFTTSEDATGQSQTTWDTITQAVSEAWALIESIFTTATEIIMTLWGFFGEDIISVFSTVWESISSVISGAVSVVSGIFDVIVGIFTGNGEKIKEGFGKIWEGIKGIFGGVADFFSGIWDKVVSLFKKVGTKIGDAIGGAFKTVVNSIIGFAENMINGFIKAINVAIKVINLIPGVNIKKLDLLVIPRLAAGGMVDAGQMFIAREAGPELVGSFGSRAAVMNNNQIVESVSRGVYNAVRSAMGTGNSSYTFNITNQLDGREIGRQVIKYHNGVVKQTGMSPLLI